MSPLAQFRARMEADPALQEKLSAPFDPASFITLVVDSARGCGLSIDGDAVAAAMEDRRPVATAPPAGWLPVRTRWRDGGLDLEWIHIGQHQLREPFFEETVLRCAVSPFNRLFRYSTPIGALEDWLRVHPGVPPTGFIFHMSRCGSTLVSQMLTALPDSVVISEAASIDDVVQARLTRPDLDESRHAAWLSWMIGALGQPRVGGERHLFVKLDSWHTPALPLFCRAFPAVPWIFVYRDPLEIMVSHEKQRGMHVVPGLIAPELFGFGPAEAALPREQYCARALACVCDGALQAYAGGAALLVNYRQLPEALWSEVLPHFGVTCSEHDRAAMIEAARYDAKAPNQPFADDSAAKQQSATAAIRFAAEELRGCYDRLETLRLGG